MFSAYKGCYKYKPVINKQPFDQGKLNLMCIFFKASVDQAIKNNHTNQQKWLPSANQISAVNNLHEAVYSIKGEQSTKRHYNKLKYIFASNLRILMARANINIS